MNIFFIVRIFCRLEGKVDSQCHGTQLLYELLEKEPQEGTEDIIVNFIRPKYTQGILVELIQQVGDINYDATFTSRWGNEK